MFSRHASNGKVRLVLKPCSGASQSMVLNVCGVFGRLDHKFVVILMVIIDYVVEVHFFGTYVSIGTSAIAWKYT